MRAVIDPTKSFESTVYGAEDMVRIFPELKPGGVGVLLEQDDDDPDLYYIVDETRGIHVNDCAFFSTDELWHMIVTNDEGNVICTGEPKDTDIYPDLVDIPGVIRRGSLVVDTNGNYGVVVRMNAWGRAIEDLDDEHHGTVEVWRRDDCNYGANNCEHYTLQNYKDFLTVVEY